MAPTSCVLDGAREVAEGVVDGGREAVRSVERLDTFSTAGESVGNVVRELTEDYEDQRGIQDPVCDPWEFFGGVEDAY